MIKGNGDMDGRGEGLKPEEVGKVKVRFGLAQQGHIPTIERMLSEHRPWSEIAKAIGWEEHGAMEWYIRHLRTLAAPTVSTPEPSPAPHLEAQDREIAILFHFLDRIREASAGHPYVAELLLGAHSAVNNLRALLPRDPGTLPHVEGWKKTKWADPWQGKEPPEPRDPSGKGGQP